MIEFLLSHVSEIFNLDIHTINIEAHIINLSYLTQAFVLDLMQFADFFIFSESCR